MSSNKRKRPTAAAPSSKRNSNLFAKRDDDDDITRFRQNYNNVNSTLQTIPEKKRVLPLISLAIDVAGANPRRCLSGKSNPLDRVADRFHQPILNAVFQHCVVGDDERNLSLPDFIRIFIDRPPGSIDTFDAQVSLSLPVMTAVMSVLAGKDPYPSDGGIASGLQVLSLATSMISEKALQSAIPNLNNLTTLSCEGCAKIKDQALATVVKHCVSLKRVDVTMTGCTSEGILALVRAPSVKSIRCGGINMGPDRLWAAAAAEEEVEGGKPDALQLDSLEMPACLKIGRTGLESILRAFGRALTVLDIAGFPGEYRTDTLLPCIPSLVDLNISSWRCPSVNEAAQLVTLLKASNQLKTFIATNVATSLSSDSLIVGLPDTLKKLSRSELGTSSRPQGSGFDIRLISGKFQYPNLTELHLAGLGMRKWSLEDIEPQDVEGLWPHMRHIDVSRNPLGDEFVAMLAGACPRLESILLSQTNVTEIGIRTLVVSCPGLVQMDMAACRSIPIKDRRDLFLRTHQEIYRSAPNSGSSICAQ